MNQISSVAPLTSHRLKGKIAIITGGASGFGKTTVELFVQHGAKVVVADVQDEQGLALCNEIIVSINNTNKNNNDDNNGHEGIITYIHCDVTDENDVKNLIDITISKHGKLDIMFNNAGIYGDLNPCHSSILTTTNDNFKRVFETNVYGSFLGAKHAARVMIPGRSGVILFTASIMSILGGQSHAYTMSKHAIIGLMKSLCVELGQYGIRVNSISPSAVYSPMTMNALGMDKETIDGVICESNVLKGVTPEPLDVAHAALFLASDDAKFVSGTNFFVDGGYTITNRSLSMVLEKFFHETPN